MTRRFQVVDERVNGNKSASRKACEAVVHDRGPDTGVGGSLTTGPATRHRKGLRTSTRTLVSRNCRERSALMKRFPRHLHPPTGAEVVALAHPGQGPLHGRLVLLVPADDLLQGGGQQGRHRRL